ncbi:SHOCT domain-containing protein [Demequina soli]|uniref:SHOCT domain-containing protein n=1 Tax=Demequina soli TaxID=1638987 RepID=UPI000782E8C1|nr:hypothetical protein [Demequina soli]
MMGGYGAGMTGIGWLGMGLFWIALIALIVWLVVRLASGDGRPQAPAAAPPASRETALEILDRRLAHGEIDVDTYRASRDALREPGGEQR